MCGYPNSTLIRSIAAIILVVATPPASAQEAREVIPAPDELAVNCLIRLADTVAGFRSVNGFDNKLTDEQWGEVAVYLDLEAGLVLGRDYYPLNADGPKHAIGNVSLIADVLRTSLPRLISPLETDLPECTDGLCIVRAGVHLQTAYYVLQTAEDTCLLVGCFVADDLITPAAEATIDESRRAWVIKILLRFGIPLGDYASE